MTRSMLSLSALLLVVCGCAADNPAMVQLEPADLTLEELLDRHLAALGGRDALAKIRAIRLRGSFTNFGPRPSDNVPILLVLERPDRYFRRVEMENETVVQAIDGADTWQIAPALGIIEPAPTAEMRILRLRRRVDLAGPLVAWQDKGHEVELLGRGAIEGRQTYALRIAYRDGESATLYMDATSYLPFKEYLRTQVQPRRWIEMAITYDDYRERAQVRIPTTETIELAFANSVQITRWETIEINPDIEEDLFARPGGPRAR